uniref:Protein kinase domain-containing protein n=1 Tax=Haemonchus placei TaxID=6290 RepID=A0A0N4VYS8_HAEPC
LVFIEKIGQGEFGEVHRCFLESRQVAVKRLHSTSQEDELAFLREIRVLGT